MDKSCFIKIREALDAFFKEKCSSKYYGFDSIKDKINYLIEHNYIETAFIKKYRPEFLEELLNLSKTKTSNSSHSWQPINFTINML